MNDIELKRIINIAVEAGKIMLTNGAETYRVEETVKRMAESRLNTDVNVFVIPTGMIFSAEPDGILITKLYRVSPSGIDLESIDRTNEFARQFSSTDMSLDEAEIKILELSSPPNFSKLTRFFFSGMAGGFFVLLFGGTLSEFILSYIASSFTILLWDNLTSVNMNFFIKNILGGFLASLFCFIGISIGKLVGVDASFNMVIIGPLMTLVPGVSLTNGIRDLISGELLAGSAKIMEALFIAIALAFGAGMVLQFVLAWI